MTEYISYKETAKLIRLALKKAFPKVKFSVRMDGQSINIGWTDGPTDKMVNNITSAFSGTGVDGMIDMRYSFTSFILADGTVVTGNTSGTTGSGGCVVARMVEVPAGAREVCFSTDFVFTTRRISDNILSGALATYRDRYGNEAADRVNVRADGGYGASFYIAEFYEERNLWNIVNNTVIEN